MAWRRDRRRIAASGSFPATHIVKDRIHETPIVLGFDGIHTADEVLNKTRAMQQEKLIDLEDACVVERTADGKVHIKQAVNLTAIGAASGGSLGALWGCLSDCCS